MTLCCTVCIGRSCCAALEEGGVVGGAPARGIVAGVWGREPGFLSPGCVPAHRWAEEIASRGLFSAGPDVIDGATVVPMAGNLDV